MKIAPQRNFLLIAETFRNIHTNSTAHSLELDREINDVTTNYHPLLEFLTKNHIYEEHI